MAQIFVHVFANAFDPRAWWCGPHHHAPGRSRTLRDTRRRVSRKVRVTRGA